MNTFKIKLQLATIFEAFGMNAFCFSFLKHLFSPYIRAVNYHDVSPAEAPLFRKHLEYFERHYVSVGRHELMALHRKKWKEKKPGLLLSFDDGYRSFEEVIAPLLEEFGFQGWFFVPVRAPSLTEEEQKSFAKEQRTGFHSYDYGDSRVYLTWKQIQRLAKKHIVGCHTYNHTRLASGFSKEQLEKEILQSKRILEEQLSQEVPAFSWVGGEEENYSVDAARFIQKAQYQFCFLSNNIVIRPGTSLQLLNRTPLDVQYPLSLVKFLLSGFQDLFYLKRSQRINKKILKGYSKQVSSVGVAS